MRKRLVLIMLFILIMIVLVNVTISCNKTKTDDASYNGLLYDSKTGAIIGYNEKLPSNVKIPKEIDGVKITKIAKGAFYFCSKLKTIEIPDSVTSIGERAFYGCHNLTSITISNSVTSIGDYAFCNCSSLTSITIPNSVTSIGNYAFSNCGRLTSITIPNSVISIGYHAFEWCSSLTSITIPNSVTSIEPNAFWGCNKLIEVINFSSLNIIKGSTDNGKVGYYALNIKTSGESDIVNVGDYLFYTNGDVNYLLGYNGKNTELTLPDSYNGETYEIYKNAFYYCSSLTIITIPESVTSIGDYAFFDCSSLTSITIPDTVTSIGEAAFLECSSLTSITIPDSVTSIGSDAFHYCYKLIEVINLSSLEITKGSIADGFVGYYALNIKTSGETDIVNVNDYLFYTYEGVNYLLGYVGNDTDLVLPNDYNGETYEIYDYAFYCCSNLTSITIPESVTSIGEYALLGCNLTSIVVQSGNTKYHSNGNCLIEIESKTLIKGGSTSIIPTDGSVTSIGDSAFSGCSSLTKITIPDSVTSIGDFAFSGCSILTKITIPDSVTSIGNLAFLECISLTSINFQGTMDQWNAITKGGDWDVLTGSYTIHCTDGDIAK